MSDWVALGTTILALLAAAWFARVRRPAPGTRSVRVVMAAGALAVWMTAMLLFEHVATDGLSSQTAMMAAAAFAAFTAIGLILFAIADFWLGFLRPCRSRRWLGAAMAAFALFVGGCFFGAEALIVDAKWLAIDVLIIGTGGVAVGLIWWAQLPPPRPELGSVFE